MNLEQFSSELLLYLFEFITPLDLFRTFYNLNSHFNDLILIYFQNYRFDFRSLSRQELQIICQNYIPLIFDKVVYLHLFDNDGTPGHATDFLNYNISLDQFTRLKALTLSSMEWHSKIDEFFSFGIQKLHHLTYLKLDDCYFINDDVNKTRQIIDQIWSLPKLICCYWNVKPYGDDYFYLPTVVSLSLQNLYIKNPEWKFKELSRLMVKTPNLQYFSTEFSHFAYNFNNDNKNKTKTSLRNLPLKRLKLTYLWSQNIDKSFEYNAKFILFKY
ncbi:unnamed protein product [Rotaria sp. Silwood2]|nr:unnamed protein product [Rotaria sp. Silwood2]